MIDASIRLESAEGYPGGRLESAEGWEGPGWGSSLIYKAVWVRSRIASAADTK